MYNQDNRTPGDPQGDLYHVSLRCKHQHTFDTLDTDYSPQ